LQKIEPKNDSRASRWSILVLFGLVMLWGGQQKSGTPGGVCRFFESRVVVYQYLAMTGAE
jgi:hypothetical protein